MAPNGPASNLLEGKVVVVTGASGGIGRTIAIRAAVHVAEAVIAADIREFAYLGSDLSSYVTGTVLAVDGGLSTTV
jgi:NAD(P)-dependent dehydrogenase (short-subunit alcohol dehydrogenase family)